MGTRHRDRPPPPTRDLAEAVDVMGGRLISGRAEGAWAGAILDSRRVEGGELFFALPGERTDGHRFVDDALSAGAAAAVVERAVEPAPANRGRPVVQVPDALEALHALTRAVRLRVPERLVAITGSAGKTTTKEILTRLLDGSYRVAGNPGNLNSLLGFPLALLGIPEDTEWMVAEMAMSTPGELGAVSRLGRPDVAVFTNVGAVHLEAFERAGRPSSVHTIAEAKAELLEGLADDGVVVANAADPEVVWIAGLHRARGGRVVWYALDPAAAAADAGAPRLEARAVECGALADGRFGSTFELADRESGDRARVELGLHGRVNVENFLAAATCAVELGVSLAELAERAGRIGPAAGRGRILALTAPVRALVVDDTYNSNPDALRRALDAQAGLPGTRHWAVLGDMRELGSMAASLHRRAGEQAVAAGVQRIVGVGELARELLGGARAASAGGIATEWFATADEAARHVRAELRDDDVLLVKGSRGVGLERVVEALLGNGDDAAAGRRGRS